MRLSSSPLVVAGLSIVLALVAADGGLFASLVVGTIKPSVFVAGISFALYLLSRLVGPALTTRRRRHPSPVEA